MNLAVASQGRSHADLSLKAYLGDAVGRGAVDLVADAELKDRFERWWGTATMQAGDRYRLYKLVWDLIGSEFAGRHMLYERFYAGNSIFVRNQSDREAPWEAFHGIVDGLLEGVECRWR